MINKKGATQLLRGRFQNVFPLLQPRRPVRITASEMGKCCKKTYNQYTVRVQINLNTYKKAKSNNFKMTFKKQLNLYTHLHNLVVFFSLSFKESSQT